MEKLSESEINSRVKSLEDWEKKGDMLEKTYEFPSFQDAIDFLVSVAEVAEDSRHHPDIHNSWRKVVLNLTTHDAGGLTAKDFEVAQKIDQLEV